MPLGRPLSLDEALDAFELTSSSSDKQITSLEAKPCSATVVSVDFLGDIATLVPFGSLFRRFVLKLGFEDT